MGKFYHPRWIVGISVAIILSLEISLPNQYMVGYFYVAPILLATCRISSRWGKWVTGIAICLTLVLFRCPTSAAGFHPDGSIFQSDRRSFSSSSCLSPQYRSPHL